MNSKNLYKDVHEFFAEEPSDKQKAWQLIDEFYHLVLSHMEKNNMTQADLAKKLGRSRSAISQMFNKTPNISIKKMVEIASAIGIELNFLHKEREARPQKQDIQYIFCPITVPYNKENGNSIYPDNKMDTFPFKKSSTIEVVARDGNA